ncbi:WD repeat-containing protein on Y chromosome [Teleopsis dalmanni]|uniref:WD repeat-containing protein on Y chromosome n=1 Tax=Teleopsis dalmanni TaxID=139649 RepID=UPI0018CCD508|nr:WD repeat-containing protein on Y chromosome [Teleopsis dalmanni]
MDDENSFQQNAIKNIFASSLSDPILGKHFKLPGGDWAPEQRIKLDTSLSYIPVYTHLKLHPIEDIKPVSAPQLIKRIAHENYEDLPESAISNEIEIDELPPIPAVIWNPPESYSVEHDSADSQSYCMYNWFPKDWNSKSLDKTKRSNE